MKKPITYW